MRILILNWRDIKHPLAGGAEINTHEHAKGWFQAGHNVTQLSSQFPGGKNNEIIDNVEIYRMGNHYSFVIRAIAKYLKDYRGKYDLIVDEFHFFPYFTPLYANTKVLAYINEIAKELWFSNLFSPANYIGFYLEPHFFKFYRKTPFMVISKSTKEELAEFGIPKSNIHVVHCGVTVKQSKCKKSETPVFIYLGRIERDKGIEDAIEVFKQIHRKIPESKYWIVGNSENKSYFENIRLKVKKSSLNKSCTFFGYVDETEKFDLLKKAWVLIHPSVKEGWGLTAIEAASQHTPTVAFNVTGLRDSVKHNKTGVLVLNRSTQELSNAVVTLISDKKRYEEIKKNAYAWSKEFSWKKSAELSLKLVESIV